MKTFRAIIRDLDYSRCSSPVIETATKSIIWGGGRQKEKTHIYAHTVGPRKSKYTVLRFSAGVMRDDYNATFVEFNPALKSNGFRGFVTTDLW